MRDSGFFSHDRGVQCQVKYLDKGTVKRIESLQIYPADLIKTGCPESFAASAALLISLWVSLLGDSPLVRESGTSKPERVVLTFIRQCMTQSITTLIRDFASLASDLLDSLEGTADHGFVVPWLPRFIRTPIAKEYLEFKRTGDPELLAYLLTFLQLGKRVNADLPELEATALRRWLEDEDSLEDYNAVFEQYLSCYRHSAARSIAMLDLYADGGPVFWISELHALAERILPSTWTFPFLSGKIRVWRCLRDRSWAGNKVVKPATRPASFPSDIWLDPDYSYVVIQTYKELGYPTERWEYGASDALSIWGYKPSRVPRKRLSRLPSGARGEFPCNNS